MFHFSVTQSSRSGVELPEFNEQWLLLQVFNLYRLLLSIILVVLYVFDFGIFTLSQQVTGIFLITCVVYFLFSLIAVVCTYYRLATFNIQAVVQVFTDISILTLLMWVGQDVTYGFGILINASIAGGSIVTAGRTSLLFAAYASIAVLTQHALSPAHNIFAASGYAETGILGATFFATAILAYGLSRRIRASESLASQRGVDLAKLEKLNELIIQRMKSGVIVVDENDRVRYMNQAAWYLLGIPMRQERQCIGDLAPNLTAQLRLWQKNPASQSNHAQSSLASQGILAQFVSLEVPAPKSSSATLIILDDTARMAQQAQQMKLVSLGRLTASIAHEIRNPLGAISHASQLLAESSEIGSHDLRLTEIIVEQSKRVNNVIENILQLSRRKQTMPEIVDLKVWLQEFSKQFQVEYYQRAEINLIFEKDEIIVFIDKTQLQQVLTNLCENGLRYSEENKGVKRVDLIAGVTSGYNQPFIDVIDFGKGVADDVVQYIFEPFFTTQKEGTGLGLYIAKELCEANQAKISYHARVDGGSCFRITFSHPSHIAYSE